MANTNLSNAKTAKNDEFYTQYHDIEREVEAYLEYNPDVFRDKTVLLPCDDPEWSNFTRYFAQNFERLGLKKLISTSYAYESKRFKGPIQLTLFETDAPQYDPDKTQTHGKIFVLTHDKTGDGRINIDDLEWDYLQGDGDFRSKEVTRLRDEADIIVTNPPFSLFREFLAWIIEANKLFLMIGNQNAITNKDVFPLMAKQLLAVLAESSPYTLNISGLCVALQASRNNVLKLIDLMDKAALVRRLYSADSGMNILTKPEKVLFYNTNLMYCLTPQVDDGTMRETYFASQVGVGHNLSMPNQGDLVVDGKWLFEVGGRNKGFKQIKGIEDSYVVSDGIDIGHGKKIPLWLFGLLY